MSMSNAVETAISAPCALAIASIRDADHEGGLRFARLALHSATRSGMIESFVSAYRGCPDLMVALLGDPAAHDDLTRILTIAGDRPSKSLPDGVDRSIFVLSSREKEVLSLLSQGLSNPAIGARLFISPATVKAHVHHIFDKLGVKSRAEAALRASQLSRD
jgi:DNA-binding CsgD family transcriptional regulator